MDSTGLDLMAAARPYHTGFIGFNLFAYKNRDNTGCTQRYNIPEAHTVVRGTLRHAGFPGFIKVLVDMSIKH
ncbi:saccharopine dehydrogenase (NADP+, L-glutamate-forming) [Metarhizium acridum]|uniref:saccharopine dehydrogenase (NADP+, L-glutamate-forming) n=1 Tax=Metarhizium acridum TaxID=92637 RepID=UPI001C6A9AFF|nr:saccharopine dehydrogenase (NADP+, L-glutamate-forming) [Metarhizium acridum]KAG8410733.1 saccharopine dehydrogenase (NADP+, L-glutamate-forming) [Metarhizium acridum]